MVHQFMVKISLFFGEGPVGPVGPDSRAALLSSFICNICWTSASNTDLYQIQYCLKACTISCLPLSRKQ